ncbi:MAG: hypothetical protein QME16_07700, partial [Planctomycetota bacterium]|nr:hypothetical protein [Planctomycetota bacterium]
MQYQISKMERIIGLFVFVALLLIVAFLAFNIKQGKLFTPKLTLQTMVDRGYGIVKGTVVKVNGLSAGMVEKIRLDSANLVWLTLSISYPFYKNIRI